jgi:RNA polymerase sigma-70 factor (ECF subfamily)
VHLTLYVSHDRRVLQQDYARLGRRLVVARHNGCRLLQYMGVRGKERTDEELLREPARDPEGFGLFYRRHERVVLGFFMRTTGRGDVALDLAAETFARALESHRGFDPDRGEARSWLLGIARHVLAASLARGRVDASTRSRRGMAALALDDRLVASIEETANIVSEEAVEQWLSALTPEQRVAVRGRVVEERSYRELASTLECSEAVVRQRVHRGLALIRKDVEGSP